MPYKQFMLDENVPVSIYKRRTSRSLRLSIGASGEVRVSIPTWAPYSAGLNFARSKYDWILSQRRPRQLLIEGQSVGKGHHLRFVAKTGINKPSGRVVPGAVLVNHPPELASSDLTVQKAARDGSIRALRAQAKQLLPQRLATLAEIHHFSYSSITIKQLKSRWGSCDQEKVIVLNLFLMQLPWDYIDYVLLHELMHTRIMRHGPDFWRAMTELQPNTMTLRKRLHDYQPVLDSPLVSDMP
jgi:predicted metal-dependent hydrolase